MADTAQTPSLGGNPKAIGAQEKAGQHQLALPTQIHRGRQGREVLDRMGIVFGEVVEGDPLFTLCVLPQGWSTQGNRFFTPKHKNSYLLDNMGRRRAEITFKVIAPSFYTAPTRRNLAPRRGKRRRLSFSPMHCTLHICTYIDPQRADCRPYCSE